MMIKFKTHSHDNSIRQIEVIRETDKFVVIKRYGGVGERRDAKITEWDRYHDTWADAHAYLLARAQRQLDGAQRAVGRAENDLLEIKRMTQE